MPKPFEQLAHNKGEKGRFQDIVSFGVLFIVIAAAAYWGFFVFEG